MEFNKQTNINCIGIDCCGCGNCANACPKNAITMRPNGEGFLTPCIGHICVDCGLCLNVCPQTKNIELQREQIALGAITKDREVLAKAASGGVFGTIAKHVLTKNNSFVCAASFIDGEVRHIITSNVDDIKKCQGSKYVQSNLGDCFLKIKEILKNGNNVVLFSGTPCQVSALYSYLHNRPSNLYTLDLVCHGVPSPKFLSSDLRHYDKTGKTLKDVRFRWRNPNKEKTSSGFILSIVKSNSTRLYSSSYDPYYASFMRGESFRESCYNCHYANLKRVGDISIGDFDSAKRYPHFHPGEAKSITIINNQHGEELWKEVSKQFDTITIDLEIEATANHQLSHPFRRPEVRDIIYRDAYSLNFKRMRSKYSRPATRQQKVLAYFQTHIPYIYKLLLEKLL